jgi:alkaline phosphatase
VFALFNESHMHYEEDRKNDIAGEPSLSEMTEKAINILNNNKKGYFLVVEGARIDQGHHAGSPYSALTDTIEFANAVQVALDNTNARKTTIIVTADHSHVFTIAGSPKRGNPILGKVISTGETEYALAEDDLPFTTLGYANGPGFRDLGDDVTDADAARGPGISGRVDLTLVNTESSGFHPEALVPLRTESHGGEDVGLFATGPYAHLVHGVVEQNVIFHLINRALDLVAEDVVAKNGDKI